MKYSNSRTNKIILKLFRKNNFAFGFILVFFSMSCTNSNTSDNVQATEQVPNPNQQSINIVHRYVDKLNLTDDGQRHTIIDLSSDMRFLVMQGETNEFRLIKEKKIEFEKIKYSNSSMQGSVLGANYSTGKYTLSGNKITFTADDGFRVGESWSGSLSIDNGKIILTYDNGVSFIEDDQMESL
jgi:hypothetical protein